MKSEIDGDFYCSGNHYAGGGCVVIGDLWVRCDKSKCLNYRHKHPTPEQYRQEYGEDVTDDMPVWFRKYVPDKFEPTDWQVGKYGRVKERYIKRYVDIVVACTPFPMPEDDWRPR
jgi:hypothetical protein